MTSVRLASDTIVAIATPLGRSAIGVLRISGPRTRYIADQMFRSLGRPLRPRRVCLGELIDPQRSDRVLDRVVALWFPGPQSYTGEDLLELQAHGGPRNLSQILEQVLGSGDARLAEPGEFTLRAFVNGKLDLTEAEAVADLIDAQSDAAAELARSQLIGGLRQRIVELREPVVDELVALEAELDFPEEGDLFTERERGARQERLEGLSRACQILAGSADWGERLLAGFRVLLAGPPNAGKSSLFNCLLGEERALVHEESGTTRDLIEGRCDLKGLPLVLVDGAGWNESAQGVERAGVQRMRQGLLDCQLVLLVLDASQPLSSAHLTPLLRRLERVECLVVANKLDLGHVLDPGMIKELTGIDAQRCCAVSALTGEGLEELWQRIAERLDRGRVEGPLATRARHRQALDSCASALQRARDWLAAGPAVDRAAEELREAVQWLDRISGLAYDEELLDRVFSRFCVGK